MNNELIKTDPYICRSIHSGQIIFDDTKPPPIYTQGGANASAGIVFLFMFILGFFIGLYMREK